MAERMTYHIESNHLATPESAKNWTEHSPKSKLNMINSKLNSAKSAEAKELKNLIRKREYKDFQKKIWLRRTTDLDWKLWPKTFATFNTYLERVEWTNQTMQHTNQELYNLKSDVRVDNNNHSQDVFQDYVHAPEYQQLTDSAKIHKNAREYLSKHESLSEADYNRLFAWKEQLQQWQIWNCYLVSWLIELANTDYFDTLMRTSISRVQFKDDGSLWYNIRIPLWEPDGRDILIKDSELIMAKINWSVGYRLLEIAYVKNRRKNDREWNKYSPVTEWEYQATVWWLTDEVVKTFLWRHNMSVSYLWNNWRTLATFSPKRQQEIKGILKNFNPSIWNSFISLVTPPAPWWDSSAFNVWWHTIYNKHAYAVSSVQKDSSWDIAYVNIKNPRNNRYMPWGTDISLTFNEFLNSFSYIWVCKIKSDTFLDDKWISYA